MYGTSPGATAGRGGASFTAGPGPFAHIPAKSLCLRQGQRHGVAAVCETALGGALARGARSLEEKGAARGGVVGTGARHRVSFVISGWKAVPMRLPWRTATITCARSALRPRSGGTCAETQTRSK